MTNENRSNHEKGRNMAFDQYHEPPDEHGRNPEARHPDQKGRPVIRYPIDPFTPGVELAAAIRRKEVSPLELVDSYLERMDELDPRLNAFCHRADDDVREAASRAVDAVARADSAEDLPPFCGIPLPNQGPPRRGRLAQDIRVRRRLAGVGGDIGPGRATVRGRGVRAARQDHHARGTDPGFHRLFYLRVIPRTRQAPTLGRSNRRLVECRAHTHHSERNASCRRPNLS
jgi:hypothetical protein